MGAATHGVWLDAKTAGGLGWAKTAWPSKTISELGVHRLGKMLDKAKNQGYPRPYLRNLNVRWFDFDLSDLLEMRFTEDELDRYSVRKGDLVICEGGYPGRAAVWDRDEPVFYQKALHRVRFDEPLHAKWCAYYLLSEDLSGRLRHQFNGAGIQHFTGEALARFQIPVPPAGEVSRIVAILDEAFEGIATAKANAEKNLRNARELFTSHLERVFGQRGANWHEAPLLTFTNLISTGPFGSLLHKSDYVSDGVPLVNPINIVDGLIVPDPDKLIDVRTQQRLQAYVLRENDIVVGRRGEIGRCAVVGANEAGWVCGTGCFFIRPLPVVRSEFIAHLIRSRKYRAQLEDASTGATMKNLSNSALGELQVVVPDIREQDKMLALIGQLSEECGRLEVVYRRKLTALDDLKESLLHQAFSGAL